MTAHTPGPCQCKASCAFHSAGITDIEYCSLHKAAPAMREALDNALTWWHMIPQHFNAAQEPKWVAEARALLKAIEP